MSNIQKFETRKNSEGLTIFVGKKPDIKPSLNIAEKLSISLKYDYPRCSDLLNNSDGFDEIRSIINAFLQKAQLIAGFKMQNDFTEPEKNVLVNEMVKILKKTEFISITSGHLKQVFEYGLQGQFDTDSNKSFAINARTLRTWIIAYKDQVLDKAVTEQNQWLDDERYRKEKAAKQESFLKDKAENAQKFCASYEYFYKTHRSNILAGGKPADLYDALKATDAAYDIFKRGKAYKMTPEEGLKLLQNLYLDFGGSRENALRGHPDTQPLGLAKTEAKRRLFNEHVYSLMKDQVDIRKYMEEILNNQETPF